MEDQKVNWVEVKCERWACKFHGYGTHCGVPARHKLNEKGECEGFEAKVVHSDR